MVVHVRPPHTAQVSVAAVPEPGEGDVLVDVSYAGANFYDILMVQGKYQVTKLLSIFIYSFYKSNNK
jgi:NADPH:quinone reductase-like Zn-dependent oxidoreductase